MTDIEIAKNVKLKKHHRNCKNIGIKEDEIEVYGKYKAKISNEVSKRLKEKENGKLILVTAINPTPLGRRKTTVSIAIADALNKIGKKAILALREPSLGPVFGIKGGATGGGMSSCTNGRYQFTFYRRYTCNNNSKQFAIKLNRQSYIFW